MGYLYIALIFFAVYYFVKEYIDKRSLVKAGQKYTEIINVSDNSIIIDLEGIRKNTSFYKLLRDDLVFRSFHNNLPDLELTDLDYKNFPRFKKVLEDFENHRQGSYEFFSHKKFRHLLYPYKSESGSINIVLLQTDNNSFEDFFNRNPRK